MPLPPKAVTVTSTRTKGMRGSGGGDGGALTTTMAVAAVPPKVTLVAPVKPVPVMVTAVPPAIGPPTGETLVTVGAAA